MCRDVFYERTSRNIPGLLQNSNEGWGKAAATLIKSPGNAATGRRISFWKPKSKLRRNALPLSILTICTWSNLARLICCGVHEMPLETVARYRWYGTQCVKIADRLSTIPVQMELLIMARVWIALADEADKTRNPISYTTAEIG
jgi:hypothetical protein